MATIGTLIDGKYEIIAKIGSGGMSNVYLALDRRLRKQWAIKEAKKNPGKDSNIFELTPIAEANLLKTLNHPNIVRIVDIIEQDGYIYIVEDFVEGESLAEQVKRGPTDPDVVIKWGLQLCDIFEYLHSRQPKIIYRDMKPANVQLQPDGDTIKLLDFGIAKTYKPQNVGDTVNLGTRGYAAPEQFDNNMQSDERTDIFSLGVTLRALLMGKTPSEADFYKDIRQYNPSVTDGLIRVINKATNQDTEKRYQSAKEFKYALEHYHDRDEAVVRKNKRKLGSFRALIASSISLFLIGVLLIPVAFGVRNVDYNNELDNGSYDRCIELNPGRVDAYQEYLDSIRNTSAVEGAFESNGSDKDNYTNITDEEEKIKFVFDVALSIDTYDAGSGTYGNNLSKASTHYQNLATDFGNDTDFVVESCDMSDELKNCDNLYQAIGKIKTYYNYIYSQAKKESKKADSDSDSSKELENLKAIGEYLTDHRTDLINDADISYIFGKNKSSIGAMKNIYNFMVKSHNYCLIENRSYFVKDENPDNIKDLQDCVIEYDSTYSDKQDASSALQNPTT